MNRTLLSAILIIALTALNCFAAETQQPGSPAESSKALLPLASQAIANPQVAPVPTVGSAAQAQEEKSRPIVEANSRDDGIAPQKTSFGEAAPAQQTVDSQSANASAARVRQSAPPLKTTAENGAHTPKFKVVSQTTPSPGTGAVKGLAPSAEPAKSTQGGCQSCKKKTETSRDTTAVDTTK